MRLTRIGKLVIRRVARLQPSKSQGHLPLPLEPRLTFLSDRGDEAVCFQRRDVTGHPGIPGSLGSLLDVLRTP